MFLFRRGTLMSASEPNNSVSANTLNLDGSTEYLNMGASVSRFGNVDFSFSGWVYVNSGASSGRVFDLYGLVQNERAYRLAYSTGPSRLSWLVQGGSTFTIVDGNITTDAWNYFYVYHDSVNNEVGISINNGTPTTSAHSAGCNASLSTGDFNICRRDSTNDLYFDGSMALMNCFDRILTSGEQATLYNGGIGLQPWLIPTIIQDDAVFLLPLNDDTSSNAYSDYSGNMNNATAVGSPTLTGSVLTIETSTDPGP